MEAGVSVAQGQGQTTPVGSCRRSFRGGHFVHHSACETTHTVYFVLWPWTSLGRMCHGSFFVFVALVYLCTEYTTTVQELECMYCLRAACVSWTLTKLVDRMQLSSALSGRCTCAASTLTRPRRNFIHRYGLSWGSHLACRSPRERPPFVDRALARRTCGWDIHSTARSASRSVSKPRRKLPREAIQC